MLFVLVNQDETLLVAATSYPLNPAPYVTLQDQAPDQTNPASRTKRGGGPLATRKAVGMVLDRQPRWTNTEQLAWRTTRAAFGPKG